jgi:hypothetical protein
MRQAAGEGGRSLYYYLSGSHFLARISQDIPRKPLKPRGLCRAPRRRDAEWGRSPIRLSSAPPRLCASTFWLRPTAALGGSRLDLPAARCRGYSSRLGRGKRSFKFEVLGVKTDKSAVWLQTLHFTLQTRPKAVPGRSFTFDVSSVKMGKAVLWTSNFTRNPSTEDFGSLWQPMAAYGVLERKTRAAPCQEGVCLTSWHVAFFAQKCTCHMPPGV